MKGKYTKEEIIDIVVTMKLKKSMSITAILDFLMNELGFGKTAAYQYVKWARESIGTTYNELNEAALEEAVGQLEEVMMYASKTKNYKLWLELRKELNKLAGLYVEKVDLTSNGKDLSKITFEIINRNKPNEEFGN
jgi:hypothetical protein